MSHHDEEESKAPDPHKLATILFYITLAGVIVWATAAYIYVGVIGP